MLAVDTNIIVRYVTRDDPEQAERAKRVVDENETFVTTTVLLETAWVLGSTYRYSRAKTARALRLFAGLPRVTLEDLPLAFEALDWMDRGMDFADALHLASARGCDAFITFDRRLAGTAAALSNIEVRTP